MILVIRCSGFSCSGKYFFFIFEGKLCFYILVNSFFIGIWNLVLGLCFKGHQQHCTLNIFSYQCQSKATAFVVCLKMNICGSFFSAMSGFISLKQLCLHFLLWCIGCCY